MYVCILYVLAGITVRRLWAAEFRSAACAARRSSTSSAPATTRPHTVRRFHSHVLKVNIRNGYGNVACPVTGGNPLACAAGLAVAEAFAKEDLLSNVVARGAQFRLVFLLGSLRVSMNSHRNIDVLIPVDWNIDAHLSYLLSRSS